MVTRNSFTKNGFVDCVWMCEWQFNIQACVNMVYLVVDNVKVFRICMKSNACFIVEFCTVTFMRVGNSYYLYINIEYTIHINKKINFSVNMARDNKNQKFKYLSWHSLSLRLANYNRIFYFLQFFGKSENFCSIWKHFVLKTLNSFDCKHKFSIII